MSRHTPSSIVVALALTAGCAETHTPSTVLTEIDASDAVSIQLNDAIGDRVVRVPIRQVNSYGVGVPGGTARLAIRGGGASFEEDIVSFDSHGYATAKVVVPSGGIFEVQVQEADRTDDIGPPATGYSLSTELPAYGLSNTALLPSEVVDPTRIAAGADGVAIASEDELWWIPSTPGGVPHQVADLPFLIDGLWSVHIDGDGTPDLVAWADSQVIVLRGRSKGGYGWGSAWAAANHEISGVAAEDVNSDRLADLVISSSTDEGAVIEVLLGDGAWGFDALPPLELGYPVDSLTASDDDRDGSPDITLLNAATGTLRRYTFDGDNWIGGSPPEITAYNAEPGSTLLSAINLDGQGAAEIVISPPPSGGKQDLIFYVLGTPPVKYPLSFDPYELASGDIDVDGTDELLVLEKDSLNVVRYSPGSDRYISHTIQGTGARGPIASADFDGDSLAEIAVVASSAQVNFRAGATTPEGDWTLSSPTWRNYDLGELGPFVVDDFDSNGWADMAAITGTETLQLSLWRFALSEDGSPVMHTQKIIDLTGGFSPLDVAVCGNNVYALVGTPDGQRVFRAQIEGSGDWSATSKWAGGIAVSGKYLDCGVVKPSTAGIAISTKDGAWTTMDYTSAIVATGELGAVGNIALADTDGNGVDEVVYCSAADCEVVAGDMDGDGLEEIAASGGGTALRGWGKRVTLAGSGSVSMDDFDNNGRGDVLVYDHTSEALIIHRGMDSGVAPAAALATHRALRGPVFMGDVDGDGVLELLSVDEDGDLVHTQASTYVEAEQDGDTGR
jgi:hypothetical protein